MASILIAEDESRIASFVEKGLRAAGHTTAVAATGNDALELALTDDFELLVLDIGLPGLNGFEVLEQLRGQGFTLPVIILTARDSVTDTVAGLDRGADDYMAKPFRIEELLARVRSRLRQTAGDQPTSLGHGDLKLDLHTRLASIGSKTIELSAREFSLLETLLRNAGQVMTREQLLSRVWGYDFDPGSNVVDVYIRYLRNKIGADRILTVRGAGYRLVS